MRTAVVVPFKRRSPGLSNKRWILLIAACQELYYNEELKAREAPQTETEKKILTMLKRHFSEDDAPKVLEMIIISYHLRISFPELERQQLKVMRTLMSRLLATVHYDRKIKDWVWSAYQGIVRDIPPAWDILC